MLVVFFILKQRAEFFIIIIKKQCFTALFFAYCPFLVSASPAQGQLRSSPPPPPASARGDALRGAHLLAAQPAVAGRAAPEPACHRRLQRGHAGLRRALPAEGRRRPVRGRGGILNSVCGGGARITAIPFHGRCVAPNFHQFDTCWRMTSCRAQTGAGEGRG